MGVGDVWRVGKLGEEEVVAWTARGAVRHGLRGLYGCVRINDAFP